MKYRGSKIALLGLLFALSLVLSFVESSFGGFGALPGVKPGLSNIVVMYCVFFLGAREAYFLSVLKAAFTLMTRGPVGALMSLSGGLCSVTVMLFIKRTSKGEGGYFTSICGGLSHNAGQLFMASLLLKSDMVFYYFPMLALSGAVMGVLTGFLLRLLMPHFKRIFLK